MAPALPPPSDVRWSVPVVVADIPEKGLRIAIAVPDDERAAIAHLAGLRGLARLEGTFELKPAPHAGVRVSGRITADVEQTCIVTLEPVENLVEETVDVAFAPPGAIVEPSSEEDGAETDIDAPEPIVDGTIDLAKIAVEFLILGLDPYPRKPGAVFEPVLTPEDPTDHPFAKLAALKPEKGELGQPGGKKRGKSR